MTITFPVGSLRLKFFAHIVDAKIPILLSIDDTDWLKVYLSNLEDVGEPSSSDTSDSVTRKSGR